MNGNVISQLSKTEAEIDRMGYTDESGKYVRTKIFELQDYDGNPITDISDIYLSEIILNPIVIPDWWDREKNKVKFNYGFKFGWAGFYPDPQKYSNKVKFKLFVNDHPSAYKMFLGEVYIHDGKYYTTHHYFM